MTRPDFTASLDEVRRAYREAAQRASRPGFVGAMRPMVTPLVTLDLEPGEWSRTEREPARV